MKKAFIASLFMVFVLALGSALAAEDTGTMIYREWLKPQAPMSGSPVVKDFGRRGPIMSEAPVDVGTALYNEAFPRESVVTEKSHATAGEIKEDENTRIWDNLMSRG